MLGKGERRRRAATALDELRAVLNLALGAASGARERAETAKRALEFEQTVQKLGLARATRDADVRAAVEGDPALAAVWARICAERDAGYEEWRRDGLGAVRALATAETAGPPGAPWEHWLGRLGTDPGASAPSLWRLGTAQVEHASPEDGFPLAVPFLDRANLRLNSALGARPAVDSMVETLLLRLLSTFTPGLVRLHLWDIGHLTGPLPNLHPLTAAGLLVVHDPTRLDDLLAHLAGHIRKVHTNSLRSGGVLPTAASRVAGRRVEPWRVAVLFGNGERLPDEQYRELNRVARTGPEAGVHLVLVDMPVSTTSAVETVTFTDAEVATSSMTGPGVLVRADPPLPPAAVSRAAAVIRDDTLTRRGRPRSFVDLLPPVLGQESSRDELRTTIGFAEGDPIEVVLGDATPHALVAGPSGTGKTNLLYAMLGGLAARYGPDELELYLLDFKEGVSFAGLTPGRKDPSWLPQARLVGVNVNTDREFGLALLRFLAQELARRAEAAKREEVTKLAELRDADPDGRWPRIVAVIDEFQALFTGRDQITQQAATLLEDVARRGRSQGIHLVLASQDIAGIEAFWGKPAVYDQCTLRIAMPKAKRVLAQDNNAAVSLPRWHAVINHESGVPHGNEIAHIPDSSSRGTFDAMQRQLWAALESAAPRLFDGAHQPELARAAAYLGRTGPLLGQVIDVDDRSAVLRVEAAPGRNLAVLGTATEDALSIMDSAALSLARAHEHDRGSVEFVLLCAVSEHNKRVGKLAKAIEDTGFGVEVLLGDRVVDLPAEKPESKSRFVFFYAVDAALPALGTGGLEKLRSLLKNGPASGVHTFGWWRGVSRLKDTLGFNGMDDIGAWVALDVQGAELNAFAAGQVVTWSPRPHRAVFFDRSTHSKPEVLIPFDTTTALEQR
ncbi:FtsK/SpoIIIE domain-containing protein [Actinokineospora sp. NBRC 105648]|uniref:FtsK/SpoIIIE domain-containing protein n=1 Tax=Actinokineospora sp. NBRC 105648 TaxID=3032206 RepID=UPI0024A5F8E1|nr:FtsK/SpoIIIE domain-containing protein [Actinokineospora sp. NBRC 105648]GLZ41906.1 cell division protein FtsK [Actinokineospora sp. NBRC 105648]